MARRSRTSTPTTAIAAKVTDKTPSPCKTSPDVGVMGFAEVSMMDDRIALSLGASVTSVREPLGSADSTPLRLVWAADTPPGSAVLGLGRTRARERANWS